jgi:hypothetical protein
MDYYHRLVVRTPFLEWQIPLDIAVGGIRIRFERSVSGELVEPTRQQQIGNSISIEGGKGGPITHEGQFIEIICGGIDPDAAELRAHATLGFLAFCIGDQAIGEIVFSEAYHGDPDEQYSAVSATTHHEIPAQLNRSLLDTIASCLPRITTSISEADALALALRWYEHGLTRTSPLDRVISHFVGIEAIIKDYGKRTNLRSSLAPLKEDPAFLACIEGFTTATNADALKRLIGGLGNPSNVDRFESYATHHRLGDEWIARFRRLSQIRNQAIHSAEVAASEEDALDAQFLLRLLIKKEFHLVGLLRSDVFPGRVRDSVQWTEKEGWVRTPKADWSKRFSDATKLS